MSDPRPLTVCFFGTYEADYPRNRILRRALEAAGCRVIDCHVDIWSGHTHKTGLLGSAGALRLAVTLVPAYARLAWRYARAARHDAVLIGYPGHVDALLASVLRRMRGRPRLVLDVFISLHDTAVGDRSVVRTGSTKARLLRALDRAACGVTDEVLLDTDAHIAFFAQTLDLPNARFTRLWAGGEDPLFSPTPPRRQDGEVRLLFVGKFIPLHGIDVVLQAAKLLEDDPRVRLRLVGDGQLFEQMRALARALGLANVTFAGWARYEDLPRELADCDIALGIFSDGAKALRVVPNKVFQAMACGRAIVTARSPAAEELLVDGEHALLVPPGDPEALAMAVRRLVGDVDLRRRLGDAAAALFAREASVAALAPVLVAALEGDPEAT
jgi:glycosyltransferase involved in cell wall biosynthesis